MVPIGMQFSYNFSLAQSLREFDKSQLAIYLDVAEYISVILLKDKILRITLTTPLCSTQLHHNQLPLPIKTYFFVFFEV